MDGRSFKYTIFFALILFMLPLFVFAGSARGSLPIKVYEIPVFGNVDPGMAAFVKRALDQEPGDSELLFVLKIDTYGGRVDSALQIVESLLSVPKGKTIAFVTNKALSAGALIALACNKLAMKHNTTIGDCAPITYSEEGPKMMGEKFQSPLRAKFRTLAKRNGFPETLAESMVTAEMEVFEIKTADQVRYLDAQEYADLSQTEKDKIISKRTVVARGELLTMDDSEARALGFSMGSFSTIDDILSHMDIPNYETIQIDVSWSETFVRLIGAITPILLMIGLAALYMEFKAPGFGLPGLIGIGLLALVFFNQYLVGLANYTELLILLFGFILLAFEVFVIPGFGIAGIAGLFCIAVGMILALQDFVIPDPSLPWQGDLLMKNIIQVLGSLIVAILAGLLTLRYLFPKISSSFRGPYLSATLKDSHADSAETGIVKAGDTGMAMTFLRPSGKINIRGEMVDAVTEGEFIEMNTPVEIIAVKGNRIVVSRKKDHGS